MAGDFDDGKQQLHRLIDQLPTEQVTAAVRYLHCLCADPVLLSLLNAPPGARACARSLAGSSGGSIASKPNLIVGVFRQVDKTGFWE
jgi:hypothetical protein